MESNTIRPIEFRGRNWFKYIYVSDDEDCLDMNPRSQRYINYVQQEVSDRMKRHNDVLSLLGISERINPNSSTAVDFLENNIYVGTSETLITRDFNALRSNKFPFRRTVELSRGKTLKISDDFNSGFKFSAEDSPENCFYTILELYKRKIKLPLLGRGEDSSDVDLPILAIEKRQSEDYEAEMEEEMRIEYGVNAYNDPLRLEINFNGAYLYLSNGYAEFSYSEGHIERKREVSWSYDRDGRVNKATYMEGIEPIRDASLTGIISIKERYSLENLPKDRDPQYPYLYTRGMGRECPTTPVSPECAERYSSAISSHEKSKELARFVLDMLYKRLPGLEQFILERFSKTIRYINSSSFSVKEIDEEFDNIINSFPNAMFVLGNNGFACKDHPELKKLIEEREFRYSRRGRWEERHAIQLTEQKKRKELKRAYKNGTLKQNTTSSE